jgi:hypothetical protein
MLDGGHTGVFRGLLSLYRNRESYTLGRGNAVILFARDRSVSGVSREADIRHEELAMSKESVPSVVLVDVSRSRAQYRDWNLFPEHTKPPWGVLSPLFCTSSSLSKIPY